MPTVLRIGSARFYFFSNESGEPPHVHVDQAGCVAKFWLTPLSLAWSRGFRPHEVRRLERVVLRFRLEFLGAWHEYFDS